MELGEAEAREVTLLALERAHTDLGTAANLVMDAQRRMSDAFAPGVPRGAVRTHTATIVDRIRKAQSEVQAEYGRRALGR